MLFGVKVVLPVVVVRVCRLRRQTELFGVAEALLAGLELAP